eukprot:CAMPEP_0172160246 /NCGR_PEP_ID=MMETSP1050-20130122/5451_1 /TAXON_ID=233186 /ORGANISM="Cryptomonas curvata, Strain CCAP979/52" /LENGTH=116 /DNA_ID=CAMNT_0012829987 /DNA_START=323 /DNA_END=671 /DNA_ORIENTATION=+
MSSIHRDNHPLRIGHMPREKDRRYKIMRGMEKYVQQRVRGGSDVDEFENENGVNAEDQYSGLQSDKDEEAAGGADNSAGAGDAGGWEDEERLTAEDLDREEAESDEEWERKMRVLR